MSVSLLHVIRAAERDLVLLTPESAGYIVLGLADGLCKLPAGIDPALAELEASGTVGVGATPATSEEECESALRDLLGALLGVCRGAGPALKRAAARSSRVGIKGFVRELEAALIPANRAAAKRSLARLCRETLRALDSPEFASSLDALDTEAEGTVSPPPAGATQLPPVTDVVPPVPQEAPRVQIATPVTTPSIEPDLTPQEPVIMRAKQAPFVWTQSEPDKTPCLGTLVAPIHHAVSEDVIIFDATQEAARVPADDLDDLTERMPEVAEEEVDDSEPVLQVGADDEGSPEPTPSVSLPGVVQSRPPPPEAHVLPPTSPRRSPRHQVAELVSGFSVSGAEARDPRGVARGLKQLAGVDLTPPPPGGVVLDD